MDDLSHDAAHGFDPKREGGNVEQQHVFGCLRASCQYVGLDRRSECDHLVGIQFNVRLAAEQPLYQGAHPRDPG